MTHDHLIESDVNFQNLESRKNSAQGFVVFLGHLEAGQQLTIKEILVLTFPRKKEKNSLIIDFREILSLVCSDSIYRDNCSLSLLEMAELQLTSHTTPRQTDCECSDTEVSAVTSVADHLQGGSEDIEPGETDIQTLKDEVQRLVRNNRKLYRKTASVAMRLSQITNKVRDPPTSRSKFSIFPSVSIRPDRFKNFSVVSVRSVDPLKRQSLPSRTLQNAIYALKSLLMKGKTLPVKLGLYSNKKKTLFYDSASKIGPKRIFRKRVAFGPCGHAPSCIHCLKSDISFKRSFGNKCPICRMTITRALVLQGIY